MVGNLSVEECLVHLRKAAHRHPADTTGQKIPAPELFPGGRTDPVTHDTLSHFGYLSRQLFAGAALQFGRRYFISKDGRFQLELTIGFGLKDKIFDKVGVPGGYGYLGHSTDINLERDVIEYRGVIPYLHCSVRFVYNLGKRLN